ncbi:hypothetical protein H2248_011463 [Termitomyces sp. 'cryptogamus']|nr:hypothetical protein H2248_011463 [Termitomyces sp. 'cryptogamus']
MCSLTLLFHINLIFASKVKMSSNLSSVPLDSSSSFHYEGTIQRTHFLLFETVAESVARISTLADHRPAFEKLLEYLQRQEKQYPDAYRHRHITTSTICDIGETRLIIRRWFKDDILSKAETTEQLRRVIQVAKVLEHLHQHRVVHGHLHPGNIFITARGDATVVDVSLHLFARAYTSQGFRIPLDSSSVYQAPEALDSRQTDLEPSSDVYAFASIVYAVMTGHSPLDASSVQSIRNSIQEISLFGHSRVPKPPVRIIRDGLWQVLERCWSYNPEARPTMKDVIFDLEDIYLYM